MEKVIRDKLIQAGVKPAKSQNMPKEKEENDEEFDEFDKEAEEIMAKMKEERFREINEIESKKKNKENNWLGEYREIVEEEFLPYVTKNDLAIVHFYHKDFERCKIFDKHLRLIAPNHPEAAFLTLNVEKAPFFVQKLQIKVLPTICFFKKGILSGKTVGFSDLGGNDEFKTIELARMFRIIFTKFKLNFVF